ncbi:hypothetical protein AB0P12_31400 [Streptomyces subrutilus]|uniref:Uncharacterized protein n=1 Tax=Streptomyces subrutilus TaxID=36818 RepID=A0A5P2UJM0_9ACTN|nr:hypothetical protein [Streptomyces subrutilus]QEU79476.1 hypothetical protein CP968_15125 [Streptomyces subrutilus]WSJ31326.1 hypothetical protein OG479_19715 [Streptomyces subrutilus]GGZ83104.1 hypothetical protein GCM10010371_48520 [Streptomyces subrutilus]
MTAIEQYLLDTWRAAQQDAPMPPPPGRGDLAALRAVRSRARFRAVLDGRSAAHPWRAAARRLLRRPRPCRPC